MVRMYRYCSKQQNSTIIRSVQALTSCFWRLWDEWLSPQIYTNALLPRICVCYLIWKRVFEDVKLKILKWGVHSGLAGWFLNLMTSVLLRDTEEKPMWKQKQRLETNSHQTLRKARNAFFPTVSIEGAALLNTFTGLQNHEMINYCFF